MTRSTAACTTAIDRTHGGPAFCHAVAGCAYEGDRHDGACIALTAARPAWRRRRRIPAYDAAAHLNAVLHGVTLHLDEGAVFVVDDGSHDATAAIARDAGVRLLQHGTNRGKGAALCTGFEAARRGGYTHVLTLDADGQHLPACIPAFLAARRDADIVIGSRLDDPAGMPRERLLSNRATAAILSALAGRRSSTASRATASWRSHRSPACVSRHAASCWSRSCWCAPARAGARITHVPIPCVYGDPDESRAAFCVIRCASCGLSCAASSGSFAPMQESRIP
jgi:hypothetical protein